VFEEYKLSNSFAIDGGHSQDYATSGEGYAIVCDGSSGTGQKTPPRTEIGSLTLANAAAEVLGEVTETSLAEIVEAVEKRVKSAIGTLIQVVFKTLRPVDFAATLLMAHIRQNEALLHLQGDGITVVRRKMRGKEYLVIRKYNWKREGNSAPPYLFFKFVTGRMAKYLAGAPTLTVDTIWFDVETETVWRQGTKQVKDVENAANGITTIITGTAFDDLIALGVFSDGLDAMNGVDWWQVAVAMMLAPEGCDLKGRFQRLYSPGPGTLDDDVSGARVFR